MEPLNPNLAALPGTVLESGPTALEISYKRLAPELEMLKQQEAAKIKATQEKAAKAAEAMKVTEYKPVGIPHQATYSEMQNQFMREQAEAEKMYAQNPLDPRYDITNPFSEAGMKKQAAIRRQEDFAAASKEKQDAYYEFLKGSEGKPINPMDMKRMKEWYERSPDITDDGQIVIDPLPVLIGNFDKAQHYADVVTKAKPDIKASSGPSGAGYIFDSDVTELKPEDIRGISKTAADNYSANQLYAYLTEEMGNMKTSAPKEFERIAAEAKKANVTWQQQKAYEDMLPLAYRQEAKETKMDGTFTSGMGTGWMKNQEGVDKFIKTGSSIVTDDPEIMKPFDMRTANVPDFVARAIPPDGKVTFTNQYNGILLTPSADKLPIVINGVYKHGNMIYVDRRVAGQEGQTRTTYPGKDQSMMMPGQALPVLQFTEEEFLGSMFEEVAAGNKDLDRETLNRRAKAMNMMQESGNIDPYRGVNPFDAEIEAGKKSSAPQKPKF